MGFKVFDAYGAASRPEATLRTSGYTFLSRGIAKRAGHERPTHYQLCFDEDTEKLGIKLYSGLSVDGNESIREIISERSGVSVNILPLLRFYGFPELTSKRVLPVTFGDDLIVMDLSPLRGGGAQPA